MNEISKSDFVFKSGLLQPDCKVDNKLSFISIKILSEFYQNFKSLKTISLNVALPKYTYICSMTNSFDWLRRSVVIISKQIILIFQNTFFLNTETDLSKLSNISRSQHDVCILVTIQITTNINLCLCKQIIGYSKNML